MKSLLKKLPDNAYFNFLRENWDDITALFKAIQGFFKKVLDKKTPVEEVDD